MGTILSLLAGPLGAPLGELAIAILGAVLAKGQQNADQRASFLNMVQSWEAAGNLPAGLHAKYVAQLDRTSDLAAAEYEKEQKNGKV